MTGRLALVLLAACATHWAHAGRPLQTEDAGVLARGGCELEGVAARLSLDGAHANGQSLQVGCGVGAATQLALAATRARAEGQSASGWALDGKTELWRGPGDAGAAFTLAYGAAWERSRLASTGLRAVFSQPLERGSVHANLGVERDVMAGERSTVWNLAYEHEAPDVGGVKLAPMAEIFGARGEAAWWNLALRATVLPDKLFIDGSYGRQSGDGKARLVTLGFKLAF